MCKGLPLDISPCVGSHKFTFCITSLWLLQKYLLLCNLCSMIINLVNLLCLRYASTMACCLLRLACWCLFHQVSEDNILWEFDCLIHKWSLWPILIWKTSSWCQQIKWNSILLPSSWVLSMLFLFLLLYLPYVILSIILDRRNDQRISGFCLSKFLV